VGVSADAPSVLAAFVKTNDVKHLLLSDARRQMLPAYGALVTDDKSPLYRYGKRAYFILDRRGIVRWMKVQDNPLNLLNPEEVLQALKRVVSSVDAEVVDLAARARRGEATGEDEPILARYQRGLGLQAVEAARVLLGLDVDRVL
jgi:alkyl hydroperoxide reductase subunit AhpC